MLHGDVAADTCSHLQVVPNTHLQHGPGEDNISVPCSSTLGPSPCARVAALADFPLTAPSFLRAQHPQRVLQRQSKIAIFCFWENSAVIQKRAWDSGHLHATSVTTRVTHGLTESLNHPMPQFPTFIKQRDHTFSCPTLYPPFTHLLGQRLLLVQRTGSILAAETKHLGISL